jgi:hypothetical protein
MTSRLPPRCRLLYRGLAGALGIAFVVLGAGAGCGADNPSPPAQDSLGAKLADAFRIDVSDIDVTYDFWPKASRVEGSATLHFQMRPGQTRALFDFNPLRQSNERERSMLTSLALDGEELDAYSNADLRRIRPSPGAEPAFEIQRRVSPGDEHTLHVTWSMPKPVPPRADDWFFANFDDTEGPKDETETMWPTISSPEDLIHHTIHLRVHSKTPYTVIGSGLVRRHQEDAVVQAWDVDTEKPVSSSTVFFAAVPSDQSRTDRFVASGVDVKIVSNRSPTTIDRAQSIVRRTIARLIRDFGPFPMPRVQILLTHWGSGMEYYGAVRTGIGSLEHELAHMYFGVTAVNRIWRDTWFDESVVVWWQAHAKLHPVGPGFRSGIGAGRPAAAPGFDETAYGAGARVLQAIARALGGDRKMMEFLADLHARREFQPFTTEDFIHDVLAAQDTIDRKELERWLLSDRDR